MDQAEPKNKIIPWHLEKRCYDTNMGRYDLLSVALVYQVSDKMPTYASRTDSYHRRTLAR